MTSSSPGRNEYWGKAQRGHQICRKQTDGYTQKGTDTLERGGGIQFKEGKQILCSARFPGGKGENSLNGWGRSDEEGKATLESKNGKGLLSSLTINKGEFQLGDTAY